MLDIPAHLGVTKCMGCNFIFATKKAFPLNKKNSKLLK